LSEVLPVYAIIVLAVYGWTTYWALWQLPSWLDSRTVGEIFAIWCYLLLTNLAESLLALLGVMLLAIILPLSWFSQRFVSRGSVFAATVLGGLMFFETNFLQRSSYFGQLPGFLPMLTAVTILLTFLAGHFELARRVVERFADNAVIFLYVSIPLSLMGLIVVIARNLLP